MKVSIQIPTYNQERFICRAIESALMQTYEDLEIVVCDDCSTDGTLLMAQKYASDKVKIFSNKINNGRAANYRRLLYDLISGDWVVNLDGDDYFTDPTFISSAIEKIKNNKDVVIYQSCIVAEGPERRFAYKHHLLKDSTEQVLKGREYFLRFYENKFFAHLSTIYNVKLAKKVGFYEYNNLNADAESLLKLALHGNVLLNNNIVGVWSIHGQNESIHYAKNEAETSRALQRVKKYAENFLGNEDASLWLKNALKDVNYYVMNEIAATNFKLFLRKSVQNRYINYHFFSLLVKKVLQRI